MGEAHEQSGVRLIQITLVAVLVVGCWLVLRPFLSMLLFMLVIAVSTWPLYRWLVNFLGHRRQALSAFLACIAVLVSFVAPVLLLTSSAIDAVEWFLDWARQWVAAGPPQLPDSVAQLTIIGPMLQSLWDDLILHPEGMQKVLALLATPARDFVLSGGAAMAVGALQTVVGALLLYFLYRDGDVLKQHLDLAAARVGGYYAADLIVTAERTITGVMFSIIGAGLAQAMVATLGFWIAGIPQPIILGSITFVLSLVPWGPVLIWAGAAFWLYQGGELAWALFMVIYGWLGISSVDNIVKPLLISRTSHLPLVLTVIGVVGGILVFGVVGLFIGPTLLALAINLARHWLRAMDAAPPSS